MYDRPFHNSRKAGRHVKTYLSSKGQAGQTKIDQWRCLEGGQRVTQESLGYVADMFPQIVEAAFGQADLEKELRRLQSESGEVSEATGASSLKSGSKGLDRPQWARFWYPIVLLNLEVKKGLPLKRVE